MRWALVAIGIVAALLAIVLIVGALQPRDHVVTMTARIAAPPSAVWTAITDASAFPSWRHDVTSVDILPATPTGASWREHSGNNALTMVVDSADAPRRLVTRIADVGLPFGGKWIYEISPDGAAARSSRSPNRDPSTIRSSASFRDSSWGTRQRSTRICARSASISAASRRRLLSARKEMPMGL